MARYEYDMDLENAEDQKPYYEPISPGNYTVRIVTAEDGRTQDGYPKITVKLEITEGSETGKSFLEFLYLPSAGDPKAANKATKMKSFTKSFGYADTRGIDSDELPGLVGKIAIVIEKGMGKTEGKLFNKVSYYL